MIFSRHEDSSSVKQKKTLKGEMVRNLKASTYFSRWVISFFSAGAQSAKERRSKPYSVASDVSREEFMRRAVIFRRQVFLYMVLAITSILISPLFVHWYVLILCSLYFISWYVIYIRDVHRVRMLIKNWELRATPLTLTWTTFAAIVKKSPKYLNPLS